MVVVVVVVVVVVTVVGVLTMIENGSLLPSVGFTTAPVGTADGGVWLYKRMATTAAAAAMMKCGHKLLTTPTSPAMMMRMRMRMRRMRMISRAVTRTAHARSSSCRMAELGGAGRWFRR